MTEKTKYEIGDIIEGTVSGVQTYGVFVQLDNDTQGLVHISECRHGFVDDIQDEYKIGQKVKVQVIDVDEYTQQISLSIRTLTHINIPPFPAKFRKPRRKRYNQPGFKTVDKAMTSWVKEALEDIDENKFKL